MQGRHGVTISYFSFHTLRIVSGVGVPVFQKGIWSSTPPGRRFQDVIGNGVPRSAYNETCVDLTLYESDSL